MATYVNDLRLKEIATGDESGTWGTSTNTNLELIAEAFSFGTEAITTNADTHTTTIADGSTDPGRSIYLKYTGTLDSACTITIGPNTVSKLWFIENGTSGSQNIIISQGSGANVTIPAGDVKAVYSDGAGSGAAIVDAFASLNVVDLKVEDDLTVTDDLIVNGDIDLEGNMDVNGSLETDALSLNGTTVTSTAAEINLLDGSSANTVVNSKAVIYGSSGELAGTLSTAAQTNITSLGTLTTLTVDDITINGSTISDGADLTVDVGGDIIFDADGGDITFKDGGTSVGAFDLTGGFAIKSTASDADFFIQGNDGGSAINALQLDMSDAGKATFNSSVGIGRTPVAYGSFTVLDVAGSSGAIQKLIHTGNTVEVQKYASSTLGAIGTATNHDFIITTNDTERMRIDSDGRVGIGETSPSAPLTVNRGSDGNNVYIDNNGTQLAIGSTSSVNYINSQNGSAALAIQTNGTERMRIDSSGLVGIGTASPGCLSGGIHAVHANAEGTPTFDGGEVLILQRNFNSAQSCSMSMVAGTNAACTINMGDKDDVNRSFITSHQGTDTMGFTVATGSALEIVSGRGGGSGRTVSATGNGGLCFGAAENNTGGCLMAAADNSQSEGIVFYLTASASEWQPASIVAHCSKIDTDQSDHNYGNVAYGFSILGNGTLATVQKYEENPSGGAGITWSLNDLGGTTTMQIQILATSANSTGPRIVLSAWAANYSGVLEANRS